MLQRIQSLWLACSAVLALLSVRFPVFSGNLPDGATGKQWVALNAVLYALTILALPVLLLLAIRGIYKDEQLVKNADKLR